MRLFRLLAAPIRAIVRFPLFQLAIVVALIFLLQGAPAVSYTHLDVYKRQALIRPFSTIS